LPKIWGVLIKLRCRC